MMKRLRRKSVALLLNLVLSMETTIIPNGPKWSFIPKWSFHDIQLAIHGSLQTIVQFQSFHAFGKTAM